MALLLPLYGRTASRRRSDGKAGGPMQDLPWFLSYLTCFSKLLAEYIDCRELDEQKKVTQPAVAGQKQGSFAGDPSGGTAGAVCQP